MLVPFSPLITGMTYDSHRRRACCHRHIRAVGDQLASLKHLKCSVSNHLNTSRQSLLTNEPPGVSCLVYLHSRCVDIRRIAEEWQPHVFNVKVIESLGPIVVNGATLGLKRKDETLYIARLNSCPCNERLRLSTDV